MTVSIDKSSWPPAVALVLFALLCVAGFGSIRCASAQPQPHESGWKKACLEEPKSDERLCITEFALRDGNGLLTGAVGVRDFSDRPRQLIILLPMGVNLKHGVHVAIDGAQIFKEAYERCFRPEGCLAKMDLSADLLARLKVGQALTVSFVGHDDKARVLTFPLEGFSAAFEGEAGDPRGKPTRFFDDRKRISGRFA